MPHFLTGFVRAIRAFLTEPRGRAICVVMKTLTARQEGFAVAVAKGSTKADAYRQNYKTDGWGAQAVAREAEKLSRNPDVALRIKELTEKQVTTASGEFDMTVKKLLQVFIEIAFTDPNELVAVLAGACRYCWGMDGAYHWKEREYLEALDVWQRAVRAWERDGSRGEEPKMPDAAGGLDYRFTADPNPACKACEGIGVERVNIRDTTKLSPGALHLYRGAQPTANGYKILFADKDKALDSIGRMLGAFDDRLRVDLKGAVASIALTTKDPQEAAQAYERMLTGSS